MSTDESWLVTGMNGCIGAWVGVMLARDGKPLVGLDRSDRDDRVRLIATPPELSSLKVRAVMLPTSRSWSGLWTSMQSPMSSISPRFSFLSSRGSDRGCAGERCRNGGSL